MIAGYYDYHTRAWGGDEGPVLHTHDFEKVSTLQMLEH